MQQEDGSSLVITLEDVTTAFRRELGAGRGRYSRYSTVQYSSTVQHSTAQYSRADLQEAVTTLTSRMRNNRLRLKIDKTSSREAA